MDMLRILEEKITSLIAVVQELKSRNEKLSKEADEARNAVHDIRAENVKLAEEKAQLVARLELIENSLFKGNERIEETKVVVDDLIRSIDALVGSESQQ